MVERANQGDFPKGVGLAQRPDGAKAIYVDASVSDGNIGGYSSQTDVALVLDTNAYADGDVLAVAQEITDFFRSEGGTALMFSVDLIDEDKQAGALDLLFFRSNVDIGTINQPYSITDAEMREKIGHVSFVASDYKDWTNQSTAFVRTGDTGFRAGVAQAASSSTSLWIAAISRDAKTYSAAGLRVKISALLD